MADIHQDNGAGQQASFDSGLNVLFLAAFPLLLWLFQGSAAGVVAAVLEVLLFAVALRLISRGQAVQRAYDAADVAYRPLLPRKTLGSLLIGLVVFILAGHQFTSLALPTALGALAAGLAIAAFGLDPMRDKGLDRPETIQKLRVDAIAQKTELRLNAQCDRIAGLGDADLTLRTDAARDMALRIVRTFSASESDEMRIRKPLDKFIEILSAEITRLEASWDGEDYLFARRRYVAKLEVLTEAFETRARQSGAKDGRDAFDVEADLLLDRIRSESAA